MERQDVAAPPGERGRSAVLVALAAGASAGTSYVVMWIATHQLPTAAAAHFLTVLAVLFFVYGLLSGLATEVTRSAAAAQRDGHGVGPSLWRVAGVASVVCAVAVVAFALVWHDRLLGAGTGLDDAWPVAALLGVGVGGYAFHSTAVGALTGRRWWTGTATVIGAEATARLGLTVVVALAGAGLVGLVAGSTVAALAVLLVLLVAPVVRQAMGTATDCTTGVLATRVAQSMLAQASAAAVVVGFPVMLAATTEPSVYRHAAPLLLAISLTRAPLLIPLNAVQGMAVSYLVHAGRRFGRALALVTTAITGVGVVGSLLAGTVGPWLMAAIFGADYRVAGWVLALLTISATLLAVLTVTGATCQATNRHAMFLGGWIVATVTTVVLLLLPGSLEQRSVVALIGGPGVGLLVHVAALAHGRSRGPERRTEETRVRA